ncbi:MAG TPA: acylneuraminate cytidylyltransferase family protein [Bacteroidia bacterium]|jgi:CMP-N-acetylneuraminic acid synthetase|nr:acylneuraminate cytidylyltransferase family protein [Bacteroidia bacterium]
MKITALVPIKKDSERISGKNRRSFNGAPLFTYVLQTLELIEAVEQIIVNTDCEEIKAYIQIHFPKCVVIDRPAHLLGHLITMNSLIEHDLHFCKASHFFQTHCTNPLLKAATIENAIQHYFHNLQQSDSLFAVTPHRARFYLENGMPVNHALNELKRTQDLPVLMEENSNFFIFSRTSFETTRSRIGNSPSQYVMNKLEAVDIDEEEDFLLAEMLHRERIRSVAAYSKEC